MGFGDSVVCLTLFWFDIVLDFVCFDFGLSGGYVRFVVLFSFRLWAVCYSCFK